MQKSGFTKWARLFKQGYNPLLDLLLTEAYSATESDARNLMRNVRFRIGWLIYTELAYAPRVAENHVLCPNMHIFRQQTNKYSYTLFDDECCRYLVYQLGALSSCKRIIHPMYNKGNAIPVPMVSEHPTKWRVVLIVMIICISTVHARFKQNEYLWNGE